ncbi:DNA recombination protein RmuC [Aquibium sp. A9E412]|uniref:DNA recombination protein RmuC n=1 Tax=Aquibium sp. A9E412 TaxID=2976767 RepID=UPI0025B11066|nr:DNA recombination protein RmuC [Aquibium sp. A9E412]MDN2566264.1 DNA recombination protein RmuC [Aquibium sp. A9E412]
MTDLSALFATPLATLGGATVTLGHAVLFGGALLVLVAVAALWRGQAARAAAADARAREAEARMAEIARAQAEMQGRIGSMAELLGSRQSELARTLGERLDGLSTRIGSSISEQTRSTHENLAKLQERLAVIDTAQGNIQALAGQVVQLQHILANKQTRGAFGQSRMEAIIADGLPHHAYSFQATLSNNSRPDCVVRMPNGAPSLVIDAKFPLESWHAIRAAEEGEGGEARKAAQQAFRRDVEVHVKAIAEKYLITGETQDTAFMFVPSESIFAEIHENYEALVQKAHRARVVIVSPSLLMLSIQVIQAVLKDARMREQAHLIQAEVVRLMADVGRLDDRVRKLQQHFQQANKDVDMILTSTDKVVKRGARIEALELGGESEGERLAAPADRSSDKAAGKETARERRPAAAETTTGSLRLRLVDEE